MGRLILVAGAARGTVGATGRRVAEHLLERGVPVRALVRKLDARSDELRERGVEVVEGDLLDPVSVHAAMKGVKRAYFTYPVREGLLEATAIFAAAAQSAGVERVVNNSQFKSGATPATFRNLQHRLGESIFDWARVGAVHLEGPPYYEGVCPLLTGNVADETRVYMPWGDGRAAMPLVGAEDVAAIAAILLADPGLSAERAYFPVSEILTVTEMVETLGRALGRSIRYIEISDEHWANAVRDQITDAHIVDYLVHLWRYFRTTKDEFCATDTIRALTGRTPQTLEQFVRANAQAFGGRSGTLSWQLKRTGAR